MNGLKNSFLEMSKQLQLSLTVVYTMARHLVHWRRAIAIPPLNFRNVYMTSPAADFSNLEAKSEEFRHMFPTVPSLPRFLSLLSGRHRVYSTIIPSRDHRDLYMDCLAWMMRNAYICQMRTFAWVKITKDIKRQVANDQRQRLQEAEAVKEQANASQRTASGLGTPDVPPETTLPGSMGELNVTDDCISELEQAASVHEDSIIADPHKASALEKLWLQKLVSTAADAEVAAAFEK